MYEGETDKSIQRIVQAFHLLGVWRNEEQSTIGEQARKFFYFLYFFLFWVLTVTCAFLTDDKSETTFVSECAICIVVITIKLMYMLWRKDEILGFIYDPVFAYTTEEWVKIKKKQRKFMKFGNACICTMCITGLFMSVSGLPIFVSEKKLPYFVTYTLDCKYSEIIYYVAFGFLSSGLFGCAVLTSVNVLVWYLTLSYSIAYEMLGHRLKRLGRLKQWKKNSRTTTPPPAASYLEDLVGLIKTHRSIFNSIERFRTFLTPLYIAHITTSGLFICVSTYNVAFNSSENIIQLVIYVVVLLYGFFEIFMAMYLFNEITVTSDQLSLRLYESNWMDQSELCKKCVIILSEVLKKPHELVVLIYPLDLSTFTKIMKGAYSMFNILKSL